MKRLIAAFLVLSVLLTGCAGINASALEFAEQTAKTARHLAVSNEDTQVVTTSPVQENAEIKLQVFEEIFLHAAGNSNRISWDEFITIQKQENLDFSDDDGIVTVIENNCEGSYLYAVLTNEKSFVEIAQLGYHYKATDGEYEVMVDWTNNKPCYLIDVTMMDSGTEVTSLTTLESYIIDAALQSESNVSYNDVEAIVKEFADAYFVADSDVMKKHFSASGSIEFTVYEEGDGSEVVINAIKGLDNISKDIEEKGYCNVSVEFKESADSDYYIYLNITLLQEAGQWKISSYGLECNSRQKSNVVD